MNILTNMEIIKSEGYQFYNPKNFENEFDKVKNEKNFSNWRWFDLLKKHGLVLRQIKFHLFYLFNEPVGKNGSWQDQIFEIEFYLVILGIITHTWIFNRFTHEEFVNDIKLLARFLIKVRIYPTIFSIPLVNIRNLWRLYKIKFNSIWSTLK